MEQIDNKWLFQRVESALKNGQRVKIRLVGQSMYPFFDEQKDVLTIAPKKQKKIRVGDTVLAYYNMNHILHRVISIGKNGVYLLQGDANLKRQEKVDYKDIMGVLVSIERGHSKTIHCNCLWRVKGTMWVKLRPARKLLLKTFGRIKRIRILLKQPHK